MKTKILSGIPLLKETDLQEVTSLLRGGKVVAVPTETVYGLAADAFQERAVREIFSLKNRAIDHPLIVHALDIGQVKELVENVPEIPFLENSRLLSFWPGPLTIVLPRHPKVPPIVSSGLPTIAVRIPSHPCMRQILCAVGSPLVVPSANLSGLPSSLDIEDVWEDFNGSLPLIVDGGKCDFGIESTVVRLTSKGPFLLRKGAITREEIEEILGCPLPDAPLGNPIHSPGYKYPHYAPKASVRLCSFPEEIPSGLPHSYILSSVPLSVSSFPLRTLDFYSHLRKADRLGCKEVAIYIDPSSFVEEALLNRIERICQKTNRYH